VSHNSEVSLLICFLDELCICKSVVLKSSIIFRLGFICVFMSSSVCLMKLIEPIFGTYYVYNCYLLSVDSSLYNMKWPSLSLIVVLNSALSDMSIAILPAFRFHFLGMSFSIFSL
jgi:hypothetical protein